MIFAAGLGTRLSPITDRMPKALVPVDGKPLLWHAVSHLYRYGIRHLVVNVHHFAHQVSDYLAGHSWYGMDIVISDESSQLLDTGGGLVKAIPLFRPGEPILVANADVFCNAPLDVMMADHDQSNAAVSLMTMQRNSTRQLRFNESGLLCGWVNHESGAEIVAREGEDTHEAAFCGFHILDYSFLASLPYRGKFPIMDVYLENASKIAIKECVMPQGHYWFDVGTIKKLDLVNQFVVSNNIKNDYT